MVNGVIFLNSPALAVLFIVLVFMSASPVSASEDPFAKANALYSESVDYANEGNYVRALELADQALALNVTSLNHLIQANRAGILVMLGRYDEAITASDFALAVQGNLTTTHSIAYYNKGNALRMLGRIPEAQAAYAKAYELDKTLVPPDLTPAPTPTRSPFPPVFIVAGCAAGCLLYSRLTKK